MRRAVLVLGGTAAGLAALFSFKAHALAAAAPAPAPSASATPAAATSPAAAQPTGPARTRTVSGPVVNTEFGRMQVKLTVTGGRITRVTVVQQTHDGAESQADSFAVPKLTG